jgi:hypothetical protein
MTIKELIAEVEAMFDELKGLNEPKLPDRPPSVVCGLPTRVWIQGTPCHASCAPVCHEPVHEAGHMGCWTPVDHNGQSAHALMICSGDALTCGECAAEILNAMPASECARC